MYASNPRPGITQTALSGPILDDSLYEANAAFGVALQTAAGATLAAPGSATVTIRDDAPAPLVSFTSSPYTVTDSAGPALTTATLSAASELAATVRFATSEGTARPMCFTTSVSFLECRLHGCTITQTEFGRIDSTIIVLRSPGGIRVRPGSYALAHGREDGEWSVDVRSPASPPAIIRSTIYNYQHFHGNNSPSGAVQVG